MIELNSIRAKDAQRADLYAQVAHHLAQGGRIQQLSVFEHTPPKPYSYNTSITRRRNTRREYLKLEAQIAAHGKALAETGLTAEQAVRQLNKRWGDKTRFNCEKATQLAARHGYAYRESRGRP